MNKVLFGSKIYSFKIDPKSYKKEIIINHIIKNYKINKNRNIWDKDSNMHHSYGDWDNNKFNHSESIYDDILSPIYNKIIKEFFDKKLSFIKDINYNFSIVNYTCIGDYQYMAPHRHLPNFIFTCVHYLQFDASQHTGIRFFNTNDFGSFSKYLYPTYYNKINPVSEDNSFMYEHYDYVPEEDEILIFHGMLPHTIPKQENTKKPRISIVTNIEIKK